MKINKSHIVFLRENNNKLIVSAFLLVLACGFMLIFNKGTFSLDGEKQSDSLTISCPDTAYLGDQIECLIKLSSVSIATQVTGANYQVSDGLSYVSFVAGENWRINAADATKYVLSSVLEEGLVGENIVGTVKFNVPVDGDVNDVYRIELINADICDDFITVEFDDVYDEVLIVSQLPILDELKVNDSEIKISPSFSTDIFEYNAVVSSDIDKINVSGILLDETKGSIVGDVGELNLHFGTNEFEIMVNDKDGNLVNTYKLFVYREYQFDQEYEGLYTYNKDNNYLYTKHHFDKNTIIINLGILNDGLVYDMNDDNTKLYIKYIDEILLEVDIINFSIDNDIVDNHIYINDLTIEELIDIINKNKVDIKIVDGDGLEVTSGKILDDYKLNVYYNDTLLDSYSFKSKYLKIGNSIIVDDQNKIFNRLVLGTTYAEIKEMIDTNGEITIISHDDGEIGDDSVVRTGDKVKIKFSDEEVIYNLSVLGDLNGDGIVTVGDVSIVYRYLKGRIELDMIFANAANIINDDGITVGDVSRLYRYLKNRVPTLEVIE